MYFDYRQFKRLRMKVFGTIFSSQLSRKKIMNIKFLISATRVK